MNIFKNKKGTVVGNGRYFELFGLRFGIGVDYAIELTKAYNIKNNVDAGIGEVLSSIFGAEKLTAENLENMRFAIVVSINVQRKKDGEAEFTNDDFSDLISRVGILGINNAILQIAKSLISVVYGTKQKKEDEQQAEETAKKKG